VAQNGNKVAGKTVEVIVKDDGSVPDQTRRLAQELVVNDKVVALAGFGITPIGWPPRRSPRRARRRWW
jgi:branched-chain amino acid transport system substrate-binding protein